MVVTFEIGKKYSDFKTLRYDLDAFEKENLVVLQTSTSMSVDACRRKYPNKPVKEELKYNTITFVCHHGGKKYRTQIKTGERPKQHTTKIGCPFKIRFRATEDGGHLELVECNTEHNHTVSELDFRFNPSQRKLDTRAKSDISTMLELDANRKLIRQTYAEKTGKNIIMKDIHNIAGKAKQSFRNGASASSSSEAQDLADWLQEEYPSVEKEFVVDERNVLTGIFIQDATMKRTFDKYPEVVLVDATHKTNQVEMPLYALMCIDGNGASQVVAAFLMEKEDENSMRHMIGVFKKHNERWVDIKVVLTDKDMTERNALKLEMPNIRLQICLFHVLRSFGREINVDKMGITSGQKKTILAKITQLTYSRNEADYEEKYTEFCEIAPRTVTEYYNKNWHPIRNEWVDGLKGEEVNFMTRTNNRLESFFGKLKAVVKRRMSLKELITQFMRVVTTLRNERNYSFITSLFKTPIKQLPDYQRKYREVLTPYAFEKLQAEMESVNKVTVINENTTQTSNGTRKTTMTSCDCQFNKCMTLPCRHILAMRTHYQLQLYDKELINQRWTIKYNDTLVAPLVNDPSVTKVSHQPARKKRVLTEHEKFKKATRVTQEMASVLAQSGMDLFNKRVDALYSLLNLWQNDRDCEIVECTTGLPTLFPHSDSEATSNKEQQSPSARSQSTGSIIPDSECEATSNKEQQSPSAGSQSTGSNIPDSECEATSNKEQQSPSAGSQSTGSNINLNDVKMPLVTKKRGRPKGSVTTAIGLPREKKQKTERVLPFKRQSTLTKQRHMLYWFVEPDVAVSAVKGTIIQEDKVEAIPENIPSAVLDQQIDIQLIRNFFTPDAWLAVESVYNERIELPWYCCKCQQELLGEPNIRCDMCLNKSHWKCVSIKQRPTAVYWYCKECKANKAL